MKSFGNIENEIDQVLDFYFHQCSVEMNCKELANAFLLFSNHGSLCSTGEQLITQSQSKRISAIMLTCGFYDEAGEFTFRVGLPGKAVLAEELLPFIPENIASQFGAQS